MRIRRSENAMTWHLRGFTLLELMVVMAVIGMLVALLLPAVQSMRESARAMECKSKMHQIGLALHSFESQMQSLPAGNDAANDFQHSWCTRILPYLDQAPLYHLYDWTRPWNDNSGAAGASNFDVTRRNVTVFSCPSEPSPVSGETDYGGNLGTVATGLPIGFCYGDGWDAGALTYINFPCLQKRKNPVRLGDISDGLSQTFVVFEIAGRLTDGARWGSGGNCLGIQNAVNNKVFGETISSFHNQGGHALFGDGRVSFISENADLQTLTYLATRSGGEVAEY